MYCFFYLIYSSVHGMHIFIYFMNENVHNKYFEKNCNVFDNYGVICFLFIGYNLPHPTSCKVVVQTSARVRLY